VKLEKGEYVWKCWRFTGARELWIFPELEN